MSAVTLKADSARPELPSTAHAELLPKYFDPDLVLTPADNPAYTPAMLAELAESIRQHGQLVPGWIAPSPELEQQQRLCLEGNRRLVVARMLGWPGGLGSCVAREE